MPFRQEIDKINPLIAIQNVSLILWIVTQVEGIIQQISHNDGKWYQ